MEYLITIGLVMGSALFSGLTIGYSSLSNDELQRLASLGNKQAAKVLTVSKDFNLLFVTLIFGNTLVNSALTDYMGGLVGNGMAAVSAAAAIIAIFGEITPGAILNRHALAFGAFIAPVIRFLIYVFYPLAKPIAMILNKVLGKNLPSVYTRDDFEYLLSNHTDEEGSNMDELDSTLIKNTLSLHSTVAGEIATKRRHVYFLKYDTPIDEELIEELKEKKYSRIPVVNDNQVIGILKVKNLLNFKQNPEEETWVMDFTDSSNLLRFEDGDKIDDILEDMLEARVHIAAINNSKNLWVGILTMEDIMNKLLGREVGDSGLKEDDEDTDELYEAV